MLNKKKNISKKQFLWFIYLLIIKQLIGERIINCFKTEKRYKKDKNMNLTHSLMLVRASTSIVTLTMCIKMHFLTATKGCFLYDSFDI